MSLMTLGVGKYRGQTYGELMQELIQQRTAWNIPEDARVVRSPQGSMYALEIIWVDNNVHS